MNTRRAYSDVDLGRDKARSESAANATMTSSLFQWPLSWAMICLLITVDIVWASQVGLTIGGGEIQACLTVVMLAVSAAFRRRNRGIANMAEAWASWFAFLPALATLSYLAATCSFPLQ